MIGDSFPPAPVRMAFHIDYPQHRPSSTLSSHSNYRVETSVSDASSELWVDVLFLVARRFDARSVVEETILDGFPSRIRGESYQRRSDRLQSEWHVLVTEQRDQLHDHGPADESTGVDFKRCSSSTLSVRSVERCRQPQTRSNEQYVVHSDRELDSKHSHCSREI